MKGPLKEISCEDSYITENDTMPNLALRFLASKNHPFGKNIKCSSLGYQVGNKCLLSNNILNQFIVRFYLVITNESDYGSGLSR